jgi:hypothetical protein
MMAPIWSNLFAIADRKRVAEAIFECIEGEGSPSLKDWKEGVERAFSRCIDWRSAPEPLIDLSDREAPPDAGHLVWPVLARGQVNVLLADQKSGKSYIGLLIAAIVASGRFDLAPAPFRFLKEGPAIYYDSETDWVAQRRRLERVCAGLGLKKLPQIHYRRVKPPFADRLSEYRADIARLGAVLAIVDSLTFASGGDLNSTETGGLTMNAIGELGEDVTKFVTAHPSKASRKDSDSVSVIGSGLFEFKARNIWKIERHSEPGQSFIEQAWIHRAANDDRLQNGFGLRLDFNEANTAVTFSPVDPSSSTWMAQRSGSHKDRIIAALQETEMWKATTDDLVKATGLDEHQVARACRNMPNITLIGGGKGRGKMGIYELKAVSGGIPTPLRKMDIENGHPIDNEDVHFPPNGEMDINGHADFKNGHAHFTGPEPRAAEEEEYPF